MDVFWAPANQVRASVDGNGVVYANVLDFCSGWLVPEEVVRASCPVSGLIEVHIPVLDLIRRVERSIHPRLSTAFEVFRALAIVAEKVHPANISAVYAAARDAIRSSTRTTRMVRILELNALIKIICERNHLKPRQVKKFLIFSGLKKKKVGELTDSELKEVIKCAVEYISR